MHQELAALGPGAHALARQLLGCREAAADVVQESLHKALASAGATQGWDPQRGPLRGWFLALVRNRCLDELRTRQRRPVAAEAPDELPAATDPQADTEADLRRRRVHAELAALPAEQREVLVLRDFMDLSYAEIATVLDIPKGTVMSRLHRARLALADRLEDLR